MAGADNTAGPSDLTSAKLQEDAEESDAGSEDLEAESSGSEDEEIEEEEGEGDGDDDMDMAEDGEQASEANASKGKTLDQSPHGELMVH